MVDYKIRENIINYFEESQIEYIEDINTDFIIIYAMIPGGYMSILTHKENQLPIIFIENGKYKPHNRDPNNLLGNDIYYYNNPFVFSEWFDENIKYIDYSIDISYIDNNTTLCVTNFLNSNLIKFERNSDDTFIICFNEIIIILSVNKIEFINYFVICSSKIINSSSSLCELCNVYDALEMLKRFIGETSPVFKRATLKIKT